MISISSGNFQESFTAGTFGFALSVLIADNYTNPVSGVQVTFTCPSSGPSSTFGGNTFSTGISNAEGIATSGIPTANGNAGTYNCSASTSIGAVDFTLTNLGTAGISFTAVSGSGQSVADLAPLAPLVVMLTNVGSPLGTRQTIRSFC